MAKLESEEQNVKKTGKIPELFITMLKIGLFTFGGGYAMISLLRSELVEKKGWLGKDEFLDVVAISESTPGPIAINSATYIGYKLAGVWGSAAATLGVCIPSFVIIYVISLFLDAFLSLTVIANAFRGIQACVVYLILSAGIKMLKDMKKDAFSVTVMTATLILSVLFGIFSVGFSSILFIIISGIAGLTVCGIRKMKKSGDDSGTEEKK